MEHLDPAVRKLLEQKCAHGGAPCFLCDDIDAVTALVRDLRAKLASAQQTIEEQGVALTQAEAAGLAEGMEHIALLCGQKILTTTSTDASRAYSYIESAARAAIEPEAGVEP